MGVRFISAKVVCLNGSTFFSLFMLFFKLHRFSFTLKNHYVGGRVNADIFFFSLYFAYLNDPSWCVTSVGSKGRLGNT